MWKWAVGILSAVIIWWLTQGLSSRIVTPNYSVTGFWKYTMKSNVSGNTLTGNVTLTQDGSTVSGVFENAFDNSKSGLKGTLIGNTLELSRDTGRDTTQTYRLSKEGQNRLVGTFANVGKFPDSGSFLLDR